MRVALTVDFEPDCPPYLSSTFRGITEGAPALLDLLKEAGVAATYFCTAEVAAAFPRAITALVAGGHELASHGVTHRAFDRLDESTARWEIEHSARVLREVAEVTSFRAPYLRFPERYVSLLEDAGFTVDASLARYKRSFHAPRATSTLVRIPASVTSSVLRLPRAVRDRWLLALAEPVVLFVHPWEFVDLRRERLRWDCRFRTGEAALRSLGEVIALLTERGARFRTVRELAGEVAA